MKDSLMLKKEVDLPKLRRSQDKRKGVSQIKREGIL